jgi:two-component system response regulator AtoC
MQVISQHSGAAPRILVVEDDPDYRELLELSLKEEGYQVFTVADHREALEAFHNPDQPGFDLVICDLRLPGPERSGLNLLKELKERSMRRASLQAGKEARLAATAPGFILLTALGTNGEARQALQQGADDYLVKGTVTPDSLIQAVRKALQRRHPVPAYRAVDWQLVGQSAAIKEISSQIDRIASARSRSGAALPVLITGEPGTGKELVARLIHLRSPCAGAPPCREHQFSTVSTLGAPTRPGLPSTLLDTELFGYVKGAFPGAEAPKIGVIEASDQGTVFLQDIADLPQPLQVKLLRVLQHRKVRRLGDSQEVEVDVRIIGATTRDLWALAKEGTFRDDLLASLNAVHIHMPPLREHAEDIPELVNHFLRRIAGHDGLPATGSTRHIHQVSPEAMRLMIKYPFPGNVSELETMLERAVIMAEGLVISLEHLPESLKPFPKGITISFPPENDGALTPLKKAIRELTETVEKELIRRALSKSFNNRTRAARLLGISHRSLLYKLKEYPDLLDSSPATARSDRK